jgi:ATP-dependent RNA helicase SUPV3L1/SUV3
VRLKLDPRPMQFSVTNTKVKAVLGPTNTGKTYLAMERLLAHGSGMIGFPLRLLARENYDRAVAIKGSRQVALITGEEKIIPTYAKYFFCTVEAMPVSKPVDFLAVDEIQMCSDLDRGHIYTDRLLNARGLQETIFMGSEAIGPLLKRLISDVEFVTRPRFSNLTYSGGRKIIRLPPRSAVVAFSANDVYAFAELIRRQRGGAAIVMGALSPRTRNAQVAMFQNGDVDYLVATDAIGMGLNMDVTHIAFSSLNKFDGTSRRNLMLSEFSQIAGRAGRHMSDGTFGITGEAKELDPSIIEQVENHKFDIIKQIQWRSSVLDYSSFESLLDSLNTHPNVMGLVKVSQPMDEKFLTRLASEEAVKNRLTNNSSIQLLWEVCQIPNFRKQMGGGHANLLSNIFKSLTNTGKLDAEWIAKEISGVDNIDGDIGLLVDRIANIRIWTYIANRSDWLADPKEWQVRTRKIEDRLSDVLHERLTQRFVDQRTSVLVKKLKDKKLLQSTVNSHGDVIVEGHFVGQIKGFAFISDTTDSALAGRTVSAAAYRALASEVQRRAIELINTTDSGFELNSSGKIFWLRSAERPLLAVLVSGSDNLRPRLKVVSSDLLEVPVQNKIEERLYAWLNNYIRLHLMPLIKARDRNLTGAARGLVFQLVENGGVLDKRPAIGQLKALRKEDYSILRHLGVKIGRYEIFFPKLLGPRSAGLSALLWAIKNKINPIPELPPSGRVSIIYDGLVPLDFMLVGGFKRAGDLLVRIDILERVAGKLKLLNMSGPFEIGPLILNLLGCSAKQAVSIVCSLGYIQKKFETASQEIIVPLFIKAKYDHPNLKKRQKSRVFNSKNRNRLHADLLIDESPFAKLKEISIR